MSALDGIRERDEKLGKLCDCQLRDCTTERDRRKLLAAVDAVALIADGLERESAGKGLDLSDDDFDRGWHGATRDAVECIRQALTAALGDAS